MADPLPVRPYQTQFEAAVKMFDDGDVEKCIVEAKKNLNNPTLPPYYIIKNCILIACALDNWDEADIWRLSAEQTYQTSLDKATRKNDKNSLQVLEDLRKELDELKEFRMEDLTGLTREEMDQMQQAVALVDENTAGIDRGDSVAESAFPIRSPSEDPTADTTEDDAPNTT